MPHERNSPEGTAGAYLSVVKAASGLGAGTQSFLLFEAAVAAEGHGSRVLISAVVPYGTRLVRYNARRVRVPVRRRLGPRSNMPRIKRESALEAHRELGYRQLL